MIGIYFSGTGNTKHCVEKLAFLLDENSKLYPMEYLKNIDIIQKEDTIILGYPTQFSNAPFAVREFIVKNAQIWKGKKVFCLNTMGLFSGDGTGCTARALKKYGATILGGVQIKMPDSVCDSKLLKKDIEENMQIVRRADERIEKIATEIRNGKYPHEGLSFMAHMKGLFGQRLWFYNKTTGYTDKLKIDETCIGCGLCIEKCPMKNIALEDNRAVPKGKCTMCYRCISLCPKKAITLLGEKVQEQCRFEKYVS